MPLRLLPLKSRPQYGSRRSQTRISSESPFTDDRRDIGHPFHQDALDELAAIIGLNVSYHGLWDHAPLGLNYSEVAMENEDPLHLFGIKHPDGSESHFSYLGNSTGKHLFKTGLGAPGTRNAINSTSRASKRQTVTEGNQVRLMHIRICSFIADELFEKLAARLQNDLPLHVPSFRSQDDDGS